MQGTFDYCSKCKKHMCCKDFDNIDFPIISNKEKQVIQKYTNCEESLFIKITDDCYNIKVDNGVCPFYNNGCTIYNLRPNDCRLYPYDLKVIEGKYYLIRYTPKCLGGNVVNDYIDDVVNNIKPYIETYTNKMYEKKVNEFDYEIIKEIDM